MLSCASGTHLPASRRLDSEVTELVIVGGDLRGADLRGRALSGAELPGTQLDCALLESTDFYACNLASCSFRDADLTRATLVKANADYAVFSKARLHESRALRCTFVRRICEMPTSRMLI